MKAFLAHAREHWQAVLVVALLAAVIGAWLPMWASLPINAAMGWTLGAWPHGVEIGPLRLLERRSDPAEGHTLHLCIASWRLQRWRSDEDVSRPRVEWSLMFVEVLGVWHPPALYRSKGDYGWGRIRAWFAVLPFVGDMQFHLTVRNDDQTEPEQEPA